MVKLDLDLERDVPELTGKVLLITGGNHPPAMLSCPSCLQFPQQRAHTCSKGRMVSAPPRATSTGSSGTARATGTRCGLPASLGTGRGGGGGLYEPVGVPSRSYTPFCLDEKLAARLWDWTEEELKPWLA